jgi:uncharacterized protein (DUF1778 family)
MTPYIFTTPMAIPVRASTGEVVTIRGQFPLSEEQWDHLMAVLDAMKPGLVEETS